MLSTYEILSKLAQEKSFSEFLQTCLSRHPKLIAEYYAGRSQFCLEDGLDLYSAELNCMREVISFLETNSPELTKDGSIRIYLVGLVAGGGFGFLNCIKSLSEVRKKYLAKDALVSGLHTRLGAGSPILTAYNDQDLGGKALIENLKTVIELAGLSDKDPRKK